MKNADMPAMPNFDVDHGLNPSINGGLTKREYFAAMAMQGLLSGGFCIDDARNRLSDASGEAVLLADALLKALGND